MITMALAVFSLMGVFSGASFRLRRKELAEERAERARARELKAWNMRALEAAQEIS